ncbi:TonB-dependent receptor [Diaphorobacter sp. HDW4B]|uniref:TonB-dependent siderophore receptor n=1 Tax=Diaphorobacter sp. HDW4B TaxID=2714925 RepID=UPI001F0D31DF|nr:TonB-dependent receptor [Diaphorobacter sp. HDW4B]
MQVPTVWAQSPSASPAAAEATRSYQIPAGSLQDVLNRLGRDAGLLLSFTEDQVQGLRSNGLQGRYTVNGALTAVLQGVGLEAVAQPQGGYVLRKRAEQPSVSAASTAVTPGTVSLVEVRVKARRDADGTTEGSGSYTSRVTSIASKTDQSFREIPQSVSVITREQLDDRNMVDIRDAMAATPGITSEQLNFETSYFYSRGFQMDSMQFDGGAPINIASYTYSVNQALDFYDRVEVMRGASGLLGGVGDPGGIINMVRKKPLAEPRFIVEQSVGSWNNYKTMIDATGPLNESRTIRARGVLSYLDRDYSIDTVHLRTPSIYGVIEADLTADTLLTAGASFQKNKRRGVGGGDLPRYSDGTDIGLPRSTSFTQPWATAKRDTTELFAALEHRFANHWKLKFNATHSKSDYDGKSAFGYGTVDRETGMGATWYGGGHYLYANEQTVLDASLSGTFSLLGKTHELLLGVDQQKVESFWNVGYSSTPTGVTPIDIYNPGAWSPEPAGPVSRRYNPWGQEQRGGYGVLRLHPTSDLHVILGGRYAKYEFNQIYESLGASGNWALASGSRFSESAKFTPYGGVIYDLNHQWSAYVSYASILKPQALMKAGPLPGSSLDPVKGKSYEAGFKGELADGRLNATLSVFNVERTGTAVADPRYPPNTELWAGSCCYLPLGKVTSRGFDAEVGGELIPGWQIAAGYTFTTTKDKSTGDVFSDVTPKHMLKLSTAYVLPGELSRWKVGASATVRSKQSRQGILYDSDWNEAGRVTIKQGGYAVWDAMAQYRIDPRWTLSLNVGNLFDKTYYSTLGYLDGSNFYGTPRNFTATLRGTF